MINSDEKNKKLKKIEITSGQCVQPRIKRMNECSAE